jgi:hypothetical protein
MTRRDYVRLARTIGTLLAAPTTTAEEAAGILKLTTALVPILTAENGRFDAARFLQAINNHVKEETQCTQ